MSLEKAHEWMIENRDRRIQELTQQRDRLVEMLLADTKRLDWLLDHANCYLIGTTDHNFDDREAIDKAMKGGDADDAGAGKASPLPPNDTGGTVHPLESEEMQMAIASAHAKGVSEGIREGLERALKIIEGEDELSGPPPQEAREAMTTGATVDLLRAAVRATKSSIMKVIRKELEKLK